jgi:hypothetical protein
MINGARLVPWDQATGRFSALSLMRFRLACLGIDAAKNHDSAPET